MNIELNTTGRTTFAELISQEIVINKLDDALDLIGNCGYQGASAIILKQHQLHPDFFDLKTKLAGDILQKFSTYNMRLAIVGDFSKYESKSLKDFIFESNKTGLIIFVVSMEEAKRLLA